MSKKKILIVEDQEMLLQLYYSILTRKQYQKKYIVQKANTAEDAYDLAQNTYFDLILTDYHLPGEDGITLIKKIKHKYADTIFIVLSGYLSPTVVNQAKEAGALKCLKKPCSIADITSTIEDALLPKQKKHYDYKVIEKRVEKNTDRTLFIDHDYNILYANALFIKDFKEYKEKKCYELLNPDLSICSDCPLNRSLENDKKQSVLKKIFLSSGRVLDIEENIESFKDEKGNMLGYIITIIKKENVALEKSDVSDLFILALDGKGNIVYADEVFANFCKQSAEQIKGKHITEYLHSYFVQHLNKQEMDFIQFAIINNMKQVKLDFMQQEGGERASYFCKFRKIDQDNAQGWKIIIVCTDEKRETQLNRLIEFERESSKQLLSGQFDMVITIDNNYIIKTTNNNCLQNINAKRTELIGQDIRNLLYKQIDKNSFEQAIRQIHTLKDVYNLRLDIFFKNKKISTLVNITGVRNLFNNEIGFVIVLRDIEKELRMRDTLSSIERMQALGQLATGMAHQINNYTNSILGSTEILDYNLRELFKDTGKSLKEQKELIKIIEESLFRLSELTMHLLTFARAQQTPVISPGDINKVVRDTISFTRTRINKKSIILKSSFDPKIPLIYFSPLHLEQAVINILMNAIDAVEGKKGIINISTYKENSFVCISIEDNGMGIPDAIRDYIFEAFITSKPQGVGTGLGLNVAKDIVSSLNGTIEVETKKNKGTKMTIKIPIVDHSVGSTHNPTV